MNYRFLKITFFYRSFLENYYSKKPEIKEKSYSNQLIDIMSEGFGWADFFKTNMEKIGNEAFEIVWNVTAIQQAWAAENGIKASGSDILFEQIKKINPDVIFFQDSVSFPAEFIRKIRREVPAVKLIIGWLCSPSSAVHLDTYKEFNFVCGCSPEFTKHLSKHGIKNYELNHAFEHRILDRINVPAERETDLIFAGSFIGSKDFHNDRIQLFEDLLKEGIRINIHTTLAEVPWLKLRLIQGGYLLSGLLKKAGFEKSGTQIPGMRKVIGLNEFPENIKYSSEFKKSIKPPVFGMDMFRELSKTKAGLNIHGGVAGNYAANSRMFEVTGMGALLITDNKKNLSDLFIPDKEVLTFNSISECKEKIRWVKENPDVIKNIAQAGQIRTLNDHTFLNRIEKLDNLIKENLK